MTDETHDAAAETPASGAAAENGDVEKDTGDGPAKTAATPARSATSRARRIGGAAVSPSPVRAAGSEASPRPSENVASAAGSGETSGATGRSVDTASPGDDESRRRSTTLTLPAWTRWAPTVLFATVAVVFLVLFAVVRLGGDDAPDTTSSETRQTVLAATKNCVAALNTYRYDKLDAAEAAGVKCTTGKLTTDYKNTVKNIIRKNAPPLKAVQQVKINTAGIQSVTKDGKQWSVLIYGQVSVTTANTGAQGRLDPFAAVALVDDVKGKWLLSKINTVSSFGS